MSELTPDEAIAQLNDEGEDAGADYHDGLEGYFGWSIARTEEDTWNLKITFEPGDPDEGGPTRQAFYFTITSGGFDR